MSSGWASLDYYYKVVPGELTLITGEGNDDGEHEISSLWFVGRLTERFIVGHERILRSGARRADHDQG